jgi:hypothetical protein
MEPGTEPAEPRYARCRRCHGVFEAGEANCPRCGAASLATSEPANAPAASYADKYTGTVFAEPVDVPAAAPRNRSGMGPILAIGTALIVVAVATGGLVLMGAFDSAAPTPRSDVVVAKPPTPTPVPTLPPIVSKTLEQLADPQLNMHVAIRTTVTVSARALLGAHSRSQTVSMDVDCAAGNESGTDTTAGVSYEWRLVDRTYYVRRLPNGAWKAQGLSSPFVVLSPLFALTDAKMLQYDGPETKNTIRSLKLESTLWWTPDSGRLSGLDVSTLGISPANTKLQLWVADDGTPVYATFRAWTDATDGTNLLDISTTYTFSNVGYVQPIPSPTIK